MSASQYRGQLDRKRKQRIAAEKKAGDCRSTEKRTAADKARAAADKAKSTSTAASKLREADRADRDAAAAGREAAGWQDKASRYAKEEAALQGKVAKRSRSKLMQPSGAASVGSSRLIVVSQQTELP